jgi:hypothetical protein
VFDAVTAKAAPAAKGASAAIPISGRERQSFMEVSN